MAARKTFTRALRYLVPSWLSNGDGGKVLGVVTQFLDETVARGRAALEARFPTRAQDDALVLIGRDRAILRGRTETRDHYVARLLAWRFPNGHRIRGSAFALLSQVSEYFGGIRCYVVDASGNVYHRSADGTDQGAGGAAWDWSGSPLPRGRFWLVLDVSNVGVGPQPKLGDPTLWGGTIGPANRGYTIGQSNVTPDDIAAITALFIGSCPWKPAGTMQQWAVLSFDGSFPVPTGNWETAVGRAAAGPQFRFWRLKP